MKQTHWTACLLFVALVLVSSMAVVAAPDGDEPVTLVNTGVDTQSETWTLERMSAAEPMPLRERTGEPYMPYYWAQPGPPGWVDGTRPGASSEATAETLSGQIETAIFGGAVWNTYPPPHTIFPLAFARNSYPHSTLGKLFFSDQFGADYVCSGAAVQCTGDQDLVMTAGHCCSDGAGNFFNSFSFVPACQGSSCAVAPFGAWNWQQVTVLTAWHTSGDLARDVCWLKVAPNSGGQELHQVTGALGFSWNQMQPQNYVATGWPAAAPFPGGILFIALSSTAELDGSLTPNTLGIGNKMTGGSSGGGWIQRYRQHTTDQFWNGLNSYKYTLPARPKEMFGPYIDTLIRDVKVGSLNCP